MPPDLYAVMQDREDRDREYIAKLERHVLTLGRVAAGDTVHVKDLDEAMKLYEWLTEHRRTP